MSGILSGATGAKLVLKIQRARIEAGDNIEIASRSTSGTWLSRKLTGAGGEGPPVISGYEIITALNNLGNVATVNVAVDGPWVAL